jgi:hypothetical protein
MMIQAYEVCARAYDVALYLSLSLSLSGVLQYMLSNNCLFIYYIIVRIMIELCMPRINDRSILYPYTHIHIYTHIYVSARVCIYTCSLRACYICAAASSIYMYRSACAYVHVHTCIAAEKSVCVHCMMTIYI